MEQLVIVVTGGVSIWLVNDPREAWRKWACVIGLAGQPFWFASLSIKDQWGIFLLAIIFTTAWARGFYFSWIRRS